VGACGGLYALSFTHAFAGSVHVAQPYSNTSITSDFSRRTFKLSGSHKLRQSNTCFEY
jgi:hypothetical protein